MKIDFAGEAHDTFEDVVYNRLRGYTVKVTLEGNDHGFDAVVTSQGFQPVDDDMVPTGEPTVDPDAHAIEEVYVY